MALTFLLPVLAPPRCSGSGRWSRCPEPSRPRSRAITAIAGWLWGNLGSADLWTAVSQTLAHWAVALVVGVAVGAVVGGVMAAIPVVDELLLGTVEFFRPIHVVGELPIMLLLLGATSQVVVTLAAVAAVWPMLLQTFYGVKDVEPVTRDTARTRGPRLRPAPPRPVTS
jgi:ABC-type nitrate/sulfonate/bicarbonate transport system permease component